MSDTAMEAWRFWWDEEGSAMRPLPNEDTEQFARRMTEIAWSNGAFKRLADVEYHFLKRVGLEAELAAAIKQRDEAQEEVCKIIARTRRKTGIRGQIVGLDRVTPAEIAAERGWDCFAEKEGGGA